MFYLGNSSTWLNSAFSLSSTLFRERDTDKDGKANFKEFYHGIYDLVKSYDEGGQDSSHEPAHEAPAKTLFTQLDKNSDG